MAALSQQLGHVGALFGGTNTYQLTGLSAFAAGDFVVVCVRNGNNRSVSSVTLSSSGTQTSLTRLGGLSNQLDLWYGIASGNETNATIVVVLSGSADDVEAVGAKVFSGMAADQSGAVFVTGSVSASTTHAIGPVTPPSAENVILAWRERSNRDWTEDSNYANTSMDGSNFFRFDHWIQSTATARSHTMVADSAGDSFSILAAFAGAGGVSEWLPQPQIQMTSGRTWRAVGSGASVLAPFQPPSVPTTIEWGREAAGLLRPLLRRLVDGSQVRSPYLADVTSPVTPVSWDGTWPDRVPGRERRTTDRNGAAPLYIPDVTTPVPALSWLTVVPIGGGAGQPATTFSYQMLAAVSDAGTPTTPGLVAGWWPDILPRLARLVPGGGRVDPSYLADVTAAVPALSWKGVGIDRIVARVGKVAAGAVVVVEAADGRDGSAQVYALPVLPRLVRMVGRDLLAWGVTTPAAAPALTPLLPPGVDLPLPRKTILALLKAVAGAAGFDLAETTRPGFGGAVPAGWRVMQYPGLVVVFPPPAVVVPALDGWAPRHPDGVEWQDWDVLASGWEAEDV